MIRLTPIWPLFFVLVIVTACEEAVDWSNSTQEDAILIVESLITNENKQQEVRLTRSFSQLNDAPAMVSGASVALLFDDEEIQFTEDPNSPGVYLSSPFRAVVNKVYTLQIDLAGQNYTATASAVPGQLLKPISATEIEDGMFRFDYQDSDDPSMMEVLAEWSLTDSLGNMQDTLVHAYFYTLDVVDINRFFAPDKPVLIFPEDTRLIRRQYSLSDDHQQFLRSYLSEVDWRGGAFDLAQGNVISNISNGALGFFAVSTVTVDSVIIR